MFVCRLTRSRATRRLFAALALGLVYVIAFLRRRSGSDSVNSSHNSRDLQKRLRDHQEWLKTNGTRGMRANLDGQDLRNAELKGVNLRRASLVNANLTGVDLSDTTLREANLQGADLSNVASLSSPQLSGADLSTAKLPPAIANFDGLAQVTQLSKNAAQTFVFLTFACLYSWVTIATTTDARLLTNSISSPLPVIQAAIPLYLFYWVAPVIVAAFYLYLHLQLQDLWDEVAELPAVFPDGRHLSSKVYPWLLAPFVRILCQCQPDRSLSNIVERSIAWSLAWAFGPITLLIFWWRYLPTHDWIGTAIQVGVFGLTVAVGTWSHHNGYLSLSRRRLPASSVGAIGFGVVVLIVGAVISFGAIAGINEDVENRRTLSRKTETMRWLRTTVPKLYIRPFADLTDATVSERPANWSFSPAPNAASPSGDRPVKDEIMTDEAARSVVGAVLARKDLRYANARGAFLVHADLSKSKLRGIDLSYSYLQRADLEQTDLTLAYISKAHMENADLKDANLESAYLGDVHLQGADMRNTNLTEAFLVNTNFTGAHLNYAHLDGAMLSEADLTNADLTWTSLCGANLALAKGLTQDQIKYAFADSTTLLPSGLKAGQVCEPAAVTPATYQHECVVAGGRPPELEGGVYTIALKSDANTCASMVLPPGELDKDAVLKLDAAPPDSLRFVRGAVGRFFTRTPPPVGAPEGTQVVNILPGDGRSGYFMVTFVAPKQFSSVHLAGRANADDLGEVFLNGHSISPSIFLRGAVNEFDNVAFQTDDPKLFHPGDVNRVVLVDVNSGGGPSGAAFYFTVTFRK